jgi:hypothetical protein
MELKFEFGPAAIVALRIARFPAVVALGLAAAMANHY